MIAVVITIIPVVIVPSVSLVFFVVVVPVISIVVSVLKSVIIAIAGNRDAARDPAQ